MAFRKILIPLSGRHDPDDPESLDLPALAAGFLAARRLDAHAEVLCVTGEAAPAEVGWATWLPDYGMTEIIRVVEREAERRRRRARAAYDRARPASDPPPPEAAAPTPGFSARFVEDAGEIEEVVGRHGRLADMIVIASSEARWQSPFRPIVEASLRRSACPVLVSPPEPAASFARRIAVAWNDSVEAARAVSAALPLLQAAGSVTVIACQEGDVAPSPAGLLDRLAWHGIAATAVELAEAPRRAPAAIVRAAQARDCDLLLLGAYLRARGHRLLFGSLTEEVLSDPKLPALLVP